MKITRLNRKEALTLYKEKTGRGISYNGLFYLAERFNFIEKGKDKFHYYYLKEKMLLYIEQIVKIVPEGFLTIKQLAEKYNITYSGAYYYVSLNNLKPFEYGSKRIKMYSEEEFKKIFEGNKK